MCNKTFAQDMADGVMNLAAATVKAETALRECQLQEARKQIGWCCATLCDKQVVEEALPKVSYEEAIDYLHANIADWKDSQFVYTETTVRDLINKIYGK